MSILRVGGACRLVNGGLLTSRQRARCSIRDFKGEVFDSTVDRGTRFENGTKLYLEKTFPDMHLIRTGGAGDGGVDLLGWWHISSQTAAQASRLCLRGYGDEDGLDPLTERMRIVVQCKAEAKKLGPIHVRELRGVVNNIMSSSHHGIAILASTSGFSKQCLLQGMAWQYPLLFLHLDTPSVKSSQKDDTEIINCLAILPNEALIGIFRHNQMEVRHLTFRDSQGQRQNKPVIYRNSQPLR